MMDGRITFNSVYEKGSVFTLTVPQRVVKPDPIGEFSKAVSEYLDSIETDEVTLYAPEVRVLVVDDNDMNLDVMAGMLKDTKMSIVLSDSGQDCIEKVEASDYDVILLDQMMPDMTGEETLNAMKERELLRGTPVIALTADAIIGAKENYLSKGFTDYISKPVKYGELERILKKYIPEEKQFTPDKDVGIPTALIWGYDSELIRKEKERLQGIYKCRCVVGKKAMEKFLENHTPDRVIRVM